MIKKRTLCRYLLSIALLLLLFPSTTTYAADNCTFLYNGGITNKQYCINPTPRPGSTNSPNPTAAPTRIIPQQTKGGQKIYQPQKSKSTPSTGPEEWSVLGLIPVGFAGWYIRKKSQIIIK